MLTRQEGATHRIVKLSRAATWTAAKLSPPGEPRLSIPKAFSVFLGLGGERSFGEEVWRQLRPQEV